MNLIVRPDGTAELDDREPGDAVLATLGLVGVTAINLTVNGSRVCTAYALSSNEGDLNRLARLMVVELTEAHFAFAGPVVLADLDAGVAHLLLELARD